MVVNKTKLWHWKSVKEQLKSNHNIIVNFSDKLFDYSAAYRYIYKSEKEALHSENYPDLRDIGSHRTTVCIKPNKAKNSTS